MKYKKHSGLRKPLSRADLVAAVRMWHKPKAEVYQMARSTLMKLYEKYKQEALNKIMNK